MANLPLQDELEYDVEDVDGGLPEAAAVHESVKAITDQLGEQYVVNQQSAMNRFNEFLLHQHISDPTTYPFTEYSSDLLSTCEVVSKLLDEFANYLVKVRKVAKFNTVSQYLSKVKMKIKRDNKANHVTIFGDGQWYKDIRSKVAQTYMKKCAEDGTQLVEHAEQLKEDDLTIMSSLLFKQNSRQADKDRGILILQKQTIGRVSETSGIRFSSIKLSRAKQPKKRCNHTLIVTRHKTLKQQVMNIFIHANAWLLCPIHALGTIMVTSEIPEYNVFSHIAEGSEATYVNRLLKTLYSAWRSDDSKDPMEMLTEHLSSHSARSGGAQDAQDHKDIQIQWVILRGTECIKFVLNIFVMIDIVFRWMDS